MAWLDDVVASLQGGGAPLSIAPANPFPDPPRVAETDPAKIWAAIEQQQAADNAAADQRNAAGLVRNFGGGQTSPYAPFGVPDVNSAGVQLAMDQAPAGTGVPVAPGAKISAGPSVPPSMQLASQIAAPPQQLAGPPAPPAAPPAAPTDLSSRGAAPVGGPTAGLPGAVRAAAAAAAPPPGPAVLPRVANPSIMDRIKAAAPDFTALGAAWGAGDWGPMRRLQEQDRALALQGIQNNATARLLQSRGASVPEIQAAIAGGPDTIKALLSEYLGKDKWKVVKTGQDENGRETYMQQNEVSGEIRPIKGKVEAGPTSDTIMGADGKPIAIPPGVDRKAFIKKVSENQADAASGKMTETQAKASSFAARMTQAESTLNGLEKEGTSLWGKIAGEVPGGNYLQSPSYRQYKQAASAFITALLRQESGAAIAKSEFDRYEKELFPQPGDDAVTIQQKAQQRAAAIEQMQHSAGPSYAAQQARSPKPTAPTRPVTGKTSSGISWSVQ